jgi:transcriptional regulator with XRE-family HTH domain
MTFAENLKSERKRLGLTQAEAATLLGVSPRAVWQWEQGEQPLAVTQEGAIGRLKKRKVKNS